MLIRNISLIVCIVSLVGYVDAAKPSVLSGSRARSMIEPPIAESSAAESPAVEFMGIVEFPGDAVDQSGLTGGLEDQSPANRLGGFSAIEYTGEADRFMVLPDRGAGDGSVSYPCRMQTVDLKVDPENRSIDASWVSTVLLTANDGIPLDGSITTSLVDRSQSSDEPWHAMDPEGLRRWEGGWLISDEYGPHIGCFDRAGRMTSQWQLPENRGRYVEPKGKQLKKEGRYEGACGCFDNRGLEGLAITPSGSTVWASYQSSLLQDGEVVKGKCRGDFTRWIAFNRQGERIHEVAYPMESRKSGISELLSVDEHQLLVLERDGKAGAKASVKRIYLADTRAASDVSKVEALPEQKASIVESSDPIQSVHKRLLIDLMERSHELGDAATAEKPEGLAWGRSLDDGRRTLWICWDNDFDPKRSSYIACYAIR